MSTFPNPSTQFQPGQSGNPNGRPKTRSMTDRLRQAIETVGDDGLDLGDTVILQWLEMIAGGNFPALVELVSRLDGPLAQALKHDHAGGMTIRVEYADAHNHTASAPPGSSDDPEGGSTL